MQVTCKSSDGSLGTIGQRRGRFADATACPDLLPERDDRGLSYRRGLMQVYIETSSLGSQDRHGWQTAVRRIIPTGDGICVPPSSLPMCPTSLTSCSLRLHNVDSASAPRFLGRVHRFDGGESQPSPCQDGCFQIPQQSRGASKDLRDLRPQNNDTSIDAGPSPQPPCAPECSCEQSSTAHDVSDPAGLPRQSFCPVRSALRERCEWPSAI